MSIEMDNPETLIGKVDAAWNLVEQMGLALSIGDIQHVKYARGEAVRLLSQAMAELTEDEHSGAGLIRAERLRCLSIEGWTAEHDDEHDAGEMARAAACYAETAAALAAGATLKEIAEFPLDVFSGGPHWPWEEESWKPLQDPIRNLTKAGALIAAEIDRLQRKETA